MEVSFDTTIDWCEANYAVHPRIAEFWNTATSLVAIAPPLAWFFQRQHPNAGVIPYLHFLAAVIFAGSAAFHGTLTWAGQLLDEVPILLWANASFAISLDSYSLSPPKRGGIATRASWSPGPRVLGCACVLQAVLITYFYSTNTKVYAVFLGGAVAQAVAHWPIIVAELRGRLGPSSTQADSTPTSPYRSLVLWHVVLGYGGFGLWAAERAWCDSFAPFLPFGVTLHAAWHLLACAALKPWTDALVIQRVTALTGRSPRYRPTWGGFGPSLLQDAS